MGSRLLLAREANAMTAEQCSFIEVRARQGSLEVRATSASFSLFPSKIDYGSFLITSSKAMERNEGLVFGREHNRSKHWLMEKYCPMNEIKQMENELWNLKVKGTNLTAYNQSFQELVLLCPEMVPNADRLLERYIEGLPLNIKGNVTLSKPVDLHEVIDMAQV
ncbi:reverse transcriptase domain-containing protein [Tanacetum coccineum]